jgi:ferritin-like metal-binding protein YciE
MFWNTGTMSTFANDTNTADEDRHTVATYLSDMLALEQHINAPIESQLNSNDHNQNPEAIRIIRTIKSVGESHIAALEAQLKAAGGSAAHGVKSAWSQLLGGGAAALNNVRKTKVSKSLRDDYTALGLAAISYTMLHATATGLGDTSTAALAKRHLDDITPIIVDISATIPAVVLQELQEDGANVSAGAASRTQAAAGEAWSGQNVSGGSGATKV